MGERLQIKESENGTIVTHGNGRVITVANWFQVDEESGFLAQENLDSTLAVISKVLRDEKFVQPKNKNDQNVSFAGDTMFIFQRTGIKSKTYSRAQADDAARQILHQFFTHATEDGYFDEIDPNKLNASIEREGEQSRTG